MTVYAHICRNTLIIVYLSFKNNDNNNHGRDLIKKYIDFVKRNNNNSSPTCLLPLSLLQPLSLMPSGLDWLDVGRTALVAEGKKAGVSGDGRRTLTAFS